MKTCIKCHCEKSLDAFYVHTQTGAAENQCKACRLAQAATYRAKNKDMVRQRDEKRANDPARVARQKEYKRSDAGKASHRRSQARYASAHPARNKARKTLESAIRRGEVTPWPVCAEPACNCTRVEGHHPDYSQPLSVVWLCDAHHKQAHSISKSLPF